MLYYYLLNLGGVTDLATYPDPFASTATNATADPFASTAKLKGT